MKVPLAELRPGDVLFDPSVQDPERLTVEFVQSLGALVIVDFEDKTSWPPLGASILGNIEDRA